MLKLNGKLAVLFAGVVLAHAPFATSVAGTWITTPVSEASVAQCVEEVRRHADYPEAGTVRHDVEFEAWRSVGHKLYISTTILEEGSDSGQRQYAAVCTVVPDREPLRFRIQELDRP